ncbi:Uncharacterised protein [Candidatus Tiddalikarchaeum anstoanum]|nr:Uncharacterised protein [Candidatus Tiddalikarchaeum anstoanum]
MNKAQISLVVVMIFVIVALLVFVIFLAGVNSSQENMVNSLNQTIGDLNG